MASNYLYTEMSKLQNDYCELLVNLVEHYETQTSIQVIEEINAFWFRNRKLVDLTLKYQSEEYRTLVYTGATVINIDQNDHFPFLMIGDFHIWDDPINSYFQMLGKTHGTNFGSKLKDVILKTIQENIKILRQFPQHIQVLPVRFLMEKRVDVRNAGKKVFYGLFIEEIDDHKYVEKYKSIHEIKNGLKPEVLDFLRFTENESQKEEFITRFENFKNSDLNYFGKDSSDSFIFRAVIYGYLCQALSVIEMCYAFKMIPFFPTNISFMYFYLILPNFKELFAEDFNIFELSSFIVKSIREITERMDTSTFALDSFVEKCKNLKFEDIIFSKLANEENKLIEISMNDFYDFLNVTINNVIES